MVGRAQEEQHHRQQHQHQQQYQEMQQQSTRCVGRRQRQQRRGTAHMGQGGAKVGVGGGLGHHLPGGHPGPAAGRGRKGEKWKSTSAQLFNGLRNVT